MKNLLHRKKAFLTTLLLILTIALPLAALPSAIAHDPAWTIPTWCYVVVMNDPIGIGQQQNIIFWLNAYPPTANGQYGDRWTFFIDVSKPDGTKQTLGPITSDPVGNGYISFTPDQVGTFTIIARFDGKTVTGEPKQPGWTPFSFGAESIGDVYQASQSTPLSFVVQQSPIEPWQETPLPSGYWTVPVNAMNRDWSQIVSNWLGGASMRDGSTQNFGFGKAPESAHVLWTKPMWAGGIMDTRYGAMNYETNHYEGLQFNPTIINGKIYYDVSSIPKIGWYCLNLYTGEVEFFHNTTGKIVGTGGGFEWTGAPAEDYLSFGQIFNYYSPNQVGGFPYLWSQGAPVAPFGPDLPSTTWKMFDAETGNYICSIGNVPMWVVNSGGMFGPGAGQAVGKDGSLLFYQIAGTSDPTNPFAPPSPPYYLQCWNTTRAIWWKAYQDSMIDGNNQYWMWRPFLNYTFDGANGYSLNVSIPNVVGSMLAVRPDEYIIGGVAGKHNDTVSIPGSIWCISLKPGEEGQLLWQTEYTPPETVIPDTVGGGLFGGGLMSGPIVDPEDDVFFINQPMTRQWWGFSLSTGQQLWGPSAPENSWNFYGMNYNIYNGMLLSTGSGMTGASLIAYDVKTGTIRWTWTANQVGFESPYGTYPLNIGTIADGKIYVYSSEHHQIGNIWRGSHWWCLDAATGNLVWKLASWTGSTALADGYLVGWNAYDNQIYCIGKGPSAMTVEANPAASSAGSTVLIQGTVTDQSPGAKDTPAISDADQELWMEYLYEQQVKPTNVNGVPVKLTAVSSTGSVTNIGTVTSDAMGNFKTSWAPASDGLYTINAVFDGSKSYGGSSAATGLAVGAPVATPAGSPAATTEVSNDNLIIYLVAATAIIIVAIAIATIVIKRK